MIGRHGFRNRRGVYEKTLPAGTIGEIAAAAAGSGYDFLELAIDESEERQARLRWSTSERAAARSAAQAAGAPISTLTLSAHRRYPWGSSDESTRARADELARHTIDLAADLGAECVQIAGYFAYYEDRSPRGRERFVDGLTRAVAYAGERGVVLALENVDGVDVTSIDDALSLARDIPGLRLYVDVGNLAGNGLDVVEQLARAVPFSYAVQLKDARRGEFRRVPFGEGDVPFGAVFGFLDEVGYTGNLSVEMWNDDGDPGLAAEALRWLTAVAAEVTATVSAGARCRCGTH